MPQRSKDKGGQGGILLLQNYAEAKQPIDTRWIDWLHEAKERAAQMEQDAPYAPKGYRLKPLAAAAPDWLEQTRFPVQDPPNIVFLPRRARAIAHHRAFHGKDKVA